MNIFDGYENVIKLMMRKKGATIHDLSKVGYKHSAMDAIKMAERHHLNTRIVHRTGELTRYYAFKSSFRGRS